MRMHFMFLATQKRLLHPTLKRLFINIWPTFIKKLMLKRLSTKAKCLDNIITMMMSSSYKEPNPVESLTEVSSAKMIDEFTVQWTKPDGGVGGYRVWVGSDDSYTTLGPDQTSHRVTSRQPATQYTVRVATVVGDIESEKRSLDITTSR